MDIEETIKKKFSEVVQKDKEMAEIAFAESERANRMAAEAKRLTKIKNIKDTDIVTIKKGKEGRTWIPEEYENHNDISGGFFAITSIDGKRPSAVINIKDPLTGKHTTRTRTRENLIDAIIARNELAATLLKEGIIDFEYFLKITQN